MARPISLKLPPRDARAELFRRLEAAPAEHAEALLASYDLLQGLHDHGVLDFLNSALGSSDKILEIAVGGANEPDSIRGIRNLLLMINMVGAIEPEKLAVFTRAIPEAVNAVNSRKPTPGLWKLMLSALWDRNIRRGLAASMDLLRTLGASLGREAR